METQFASSKRSTKKAIRDSNQKLTEFEHIVKISEASNTLFMILNHNRQIVFSNTALLDLLNVSIEGTLGQRPGEFLHCINSVKTKGGCGTHLFCKECGAVNAILDALEGKTKTNECRISSNINGKYIAFDLSVKAEPFNFKKEKYVLFSIIDISDKKRKEILEKVFFHDILNTAGGVYGFTQILKRKLKKTNSQHYETAEIIHNISDKLIKEIQSQQLLINAENNKLSLIIEEISLCEFIETEINLIKENEDVSNCIFQINQSKKIKIRTDRALLQRVFLNLLKNAAEASDDNDEIIIDIEQNDNTILLKINNNSYIEESVQHQIFQRSFSTKATDRGIGTYSIKLFTENYLQGKVWFKSHKTKGTTFFLELPKFISEL